jgi:hypothetical protein
MVSLLCALLLIVGMAAMKWMPVGEEGPDTVMAAMGLTAAFLLGAWWGLKKVSHVV